MIKDFIITARLDKTVTDRYFTNAALSITVIGLKITVVGLNIICIVLLTKMIGLDIFKVGWNMNTKV